jgi:chitinase
MKILARTLFVGLGALVMSTQSFAQNTPAPRPKLWVSAYYAVWNQDSTMPVGSVDFSAMSAVMHAFISPKSDGTVDGITPAQSKQLVDAAHAAGCRAIVSIGGENSGPSFQAVLGDTLRPVFVRNLIAFVTSRGYDGVDIDMEPIEDSDAANFTALITELRAGLTTAKPGLMLTAAVSWQPKLFASLQSMFDQINLMTYDMAGPWEGFSTWYDSPLYGAGKERMVGGDPYPSADDMVKQFIQGGVAPAKLGVGIAFFGGVWTGATGPKQTSPQGATWAEADYRAIMDQYYQPSLYHYDDQAKAAWLSITTPQKLFISYDDETVCAAKIDYARANGLGGVEIWELSSGYRADQPAGKRDVLLQAVKKAWVGAK